MNDGRRSLVLTELPKVLKAPTFDSPGPQLKHNLIYTRMCTNYLFVILFASVTLAFFTRKKTCVSKINNQSYIVYVIDVNLARSEKV